MWLYFIDGEFGKVCFMFEVRYQWLFCARNRRYLPRDILIYGELVTCLVNMCQIFSGVSEYRHQIAEIMMQNAA